eukprot:TRINITY_DN28090_c0_g5_i1.p1 TRINITY_DN28090_c0_g5~~TRINITY_DN28090_c0_g5_i1.p1  ORF type:complete len:198 (-),score=-11.07 TRINITY_DN28090_c0_g5_i1:106-699(-)
MNSIDSLKGCPIRESSDLKSFPLNFNICVSVPMRSNTLYLKLRIFEKNFITIFITYNTVKPLKSEQQGILKRVRNIYFGSLNFLSPSDPHQKFRFQAEFGLLKSNIEEPKKVRIFLSWDLRGSDLRGSIVYNYEKLIQFTYTKIYTFKYVVRIILGIKLEDKAQNSDSFPPTKVIYKQASVYKNTHTQREAILQKQL